jgi:sulfite reductase (NADPH) flavoprotein alpha-component
MSGDFTLDQKRYLEGFAAGLGARGADEAIAFVAELKKSGRYQRDVY